LLDTGPREGNGVTDVDRPHGLATTSVKSSPLTVDAHGAVELPLLPRDPAGEQSDAGRAQDVQGVRGHERDLLRGETHDRGYMDIDLPTRIPVLHVVDGKIRSTKSSTFDRTSRRSVAAALSLLRVTIRTPASLNR
jgi:hypothetical protein